MSSKQFLYISLMCSQRCCAAPFTPEGPYTSQALPVRSTFHARKALHAAGYTRAQHLSRPKGLTRRRLYPCAAPFTPEGPYTPQAIPLSTPPHYTPAALRVTILQFCREGGKKGKRRLLFIYNIYIIYIIVNIFTYIFCYFSSLSADDGLIKKL